MKAPGWLALLVVLIALAACGGALPPAEAPATAADAGSFVPSGFDRLVMLTNVTEQLILPGHEALVQALQALETAAVSFAGAPDQARLDAVQDAWLAANLARMALLPYRLGPVDDSLLHNRLDNRPPRRTFIDDEILAADTPIDAAYIDSIGSSSVGLGAMEYLLFDPAGGDAAVLEAFTGAEHAGRRRELLAALAQAATPKAEALLRIWSAEGDNYAQAFIAADMDEGEYQGSMNMLANQIIADVEDIVSSRLGKPLGKRTNGETRPDLVEAPYSGASLPRIVATLEAEKAAFTGGSGPGLDDYLDFIGAMSGEEPLSQVIVRQFDAALAALRAIDGPLETAVQSNPAQVESAYQETLSLLTLLKADMVNQLGLTLTFNDNDGD
ncbi:MAG: imelysin family protein [Candidatus Promineofilum sp.]|nr:imelysin family protein [Promineifilum sp.]